MADTMRWCYHCFCNNMVEEVDRLLRTEAPITRTGYVFAISTIFHTKSAMQFY